MAEKFQYTLHWQNPMRLIFDLLRHGERADHASPERYIQTAKSGEREDPPLSLAGLRQAELTAFTFYHQGAVDNHIGIIPASRMNPPHHIICSPFLRCLQTAWPFIEFALENNSGAQQICIEPGLSEWAPDLFKYAREQLGPADMEARFASNKAKFPIDSTYIPVWTKPIDFENETREEAEQRYRETLSRLTHRYREIIRAQPPTDISLAPHDTKILLVTHQFGVDSMLPPDPAVTTPSPYCAFSSFRQLEYMQNTDPDIPILWQNNWGEVDKLQIMARHSGSAWQDHFNVFEMSYRYAADATNRTVVRCKNSFILRPEDVSNPRDTFHESDEFLSQFYVGCECGINSRIKLIPGKIKRGNFVAKGKNAKFFHNIFTGHVTHIASGLYLTTEQSPFDDFTQLILAKEPKSFVESIFVIPKTTDEDNYAIPDADIERGLHLNDKLKFVFNETSNYVGLAPATNDKFIDLTFSFTSMSEILNQSNQPREESPSKKRRI